MTSTRVLGRAQIKGPGQRNVLEGHVNVLGNDLTSPHRTPGLQRSLVTGALAEGPPRSGRVLASSGILEYFSVVPHPPSLCPETILWIILAAGPTRGGSWWLRSFRWENLFLKLLPPTVGRMDARRHRVEQMAPCFSWFLLKVTFLSSDVMYVKSSSS